MNASTHSSSRPWLRGCARHEVEPRRADRSPRPVDDKDLIVGQQKVVGAKIEMYERVAAYRLGPLRLERDEIIETGAHRWRKVFVGGRRVRDAAPTAEQPGERVARRLERDRRRRQLIGEPVQRGEDPIELVGPPRQNRRTPVDVVEHEHDPLAVVE